MLEFRETDIFTRAITRLLSDEEYSELQGALIVDPEVGDVIQESAVCENCDGASSAVVRASAAAFELSTTGTRRAL